jgi:hypothetical protein
VGGLISATIIRFFFISVWFLIATCTFAQDPLAENALYQKVVGYSHTVDDPDRQVGNFDPYSAPSLPIGLVKTIGGTKYVIAIDSAYFLNNAAYFSAFMAIDFPGANKPLAFAAKNIQFNPEGVVGGDLAKLMLVSKHIIDIGPNTQLELLGDGTNYVNWNCNGFQSVNLHGRFLFSGELLQPANGDSCVSAEFEVNVSDLNNMMTTVNFSPFKVNGLDDFEFDVTNAFVDMSDYVNPIGVVMPGCYADMYPDDISLWRGFYLENFVVTLPRKVCEEGEQTEIYARDMFIDDAGVTGYFGASNVLSLGQGKTDGNWGFSVDSLEVGLTTNELTAGMMDGQIEVPLMDNNALEYVAAITKSERGSADYHFAVSTEEDVEVSCFSSTLEIDSTTYLAMTVQNDKFSPRLTLNGSWTLDRENAKLRGIQFQDVMLVSQAPYLSAGLFSLVPGEEEEGLDNEMAKFNISLNSLSLGIYAGQPAIAANAGLNFTNAGDATSLSVDGGFRVTSSVSTNPANGKQEWSLDQFALNRINFDVAVSAFQMNGFVDFRQDDPVYGDGFAGALNLTIPSVIDSVGMMCIFGKLPTYKYWAFDITAPVQIPLGGGLAINRLSGGMSYKMENTQTIDDLIAVASGNIDEASASVSEFYIPNNEMSVGFRAGVGYQYTPEKTLNGEVVFAIDFNAHGGLETISLTGNAYMMTTKAERNIASNYASGAVAILYDNVERIFDMRMTAEARFSGVLTADIWSQLYISPDLWFFHLGTPTDQCSVSLTNFASANGYFMFGQDLPPMAPPPPQVAGVLGGLEDGRNTDAIALGDGIGTGLNFNVGFDASVGWNDFSLYALGNVGAGFDMTLYKYSETAYCSESGDEFGANGWYLQGQLYAYGGIAAGVAGTFAGSPFDITLLSASLAMLLEGKLPNPGYIYGGVYVEASLFGVFTLERTIDFEAGENCTIID